MLFQLISKFFHIHEATPKTKTFWAGVTCLAGGVVVLGTHISGGDTNIADYAHDGIIIVGSLGAIFMRSGIAGLAKIGAQVVNIAGEAEKLTGDETKVQ
jgi:hypothetical protein